MSMFKCDVHGSRVEGRLDAMYLTLLRGGIRYSRKMRICTPDLHDVVNSELMNLVPIDNDWDGVTDPKCNSCGAQHRLGQLDAVFCTAYERGEDRQDFYAQLCHPCGDTLVDKYSLSV